MDARKDAKDRMTGATPAGHQEGGCGSFYAKIQVICVEMQS